MAVALHLLRVAAQFSHHLKQRLAHAVHPPCLLYRPNISIPLFSASNGGEKNLLKYTQVEWTGLENKEPLAWRAHMAIGRGFSSYSVGSWIV